ncbi:MULTISPECIES: polyprenyl synthetase family protein [unclassified Nitratiruptor]|uniref:polyprenyl synthetase family protein n=1 Tax=unclassified Nitratiruptor TaxID=2624044 RepID=UPI0019156B7E|nr:MULTISPECIES: polyprenyl synthetase family protein [unclassified Nitratiruptor]BCD59526.1 farnesyl diphosphate synthase [Nitratiruptor sp. YY08-10]BCD63450.1 farnesyl diphosphate synthase [Nitratiruptor sp. YY08-14]
MQLLQLFEDHLQKNLPNVQSFHPFYTDALGYMLQAGGKRFRPLLLLSIVQAKNPLLIPSALDIAVAVEIFHTYSLIHDDLPVMDDADLRRGKETLHKKFDELTAVLVGDALNTHAFYCIAKSALSSDTRTKLTEILAQNGGVEGMVHGQILDCYFEKQRLSLDQLKQLHINKTAKLIAASLQMGAVIVDLPIQEQNRLYDFGIDLGLLFQIQDDILDKVATSEEAGKTTQNDEEKNSFVNLLGLHRATEEADRLAGKLQDEIEQFDQDISESLQDLLGKYLFRHKNFTKDS